MKTRRKCVSSDAKGKEAMTRLIRQESIFFSPKSFDLDPSSSRHEYGDKVDANCVTLIVSYRTSEVFQNDYCLDTETITEGRMWRENLGRKEIYRNK